MKKNTISCITVVASLITIFVFFSGINHLMDIFSHTDPEGDQSHLSDDKRGQDRAYWISLADMDKHFRDIQLDKPRVYSYRDQEIQCNWILRIGATVDTGTSQYYHASPFTTQGGDKGWFTFPYGALIRTTDGIRWMEYPDKEALQARMKRYHEVLWSDGSLRLSDPIAQSEALIAGRTYFPEKFAVVWKSE